MDTRDFIKLHKITMQAEKVDRNPNLIDEDWAATARHFRVTLRMKNRRLTTYFSQGPGIERDPRPEDVLDCLASDAADVENNTSFEEWAKDLGYDPDSRRAERVYRACLREAARLRRFLGAEKYHQLLWETERL